MWKSFIKRQEVIEQEASNPIFIFTVSPHTDIVSIDYFFTSFCSNFIWNPIFIHANISFIRILGNRSPKRLDFFAREK